MSTAMLRSAGLIAPTITLTDVEMLVQERDRLLQRLDQVD